jgi:hypothetical protein
MDRTIEEWRLGESLQDLALGGQFAVDAGGQSMKVIERLLLHDLLLLTQPSGAQRGGQDDQG